jgi:hypothetical protein
MHPYDEFIAPEYVNLATPNPQIVTDTITSTPTFLAAERFE